MQFETDMNFEYGGGRIPSQSSIGLLAGWLRIVDRGWRTRTRSVRGGMIFHSWRSSGSGAAEYQMDSCSEGEFYSNVYFAMFVDLIFANKCDACIVSTRPNSASRSFRVRVTRE